MVFVSLEMIIDFLNFPELNSYIYTFGEYAEVLEPLKLRLLQQGSMLSFL